MNRVLIVSNTLIIGGAEKLLFELATFAKENKIEPTILILDNYQKEHYDDVLNKIDVKVVRTRINNIKHFRSPVKMLKSIFWTIKLFLFAERLYDSVHVIGLYNVDKVLTQIKHRQRYFWNVNNAIQFLNEEYPYSEDIFKNENDTIMCINNYQLDETYGQYGISNIKSKMVLFKLFIRENDTN